MVRRQAISGTPKSIRPYWYLVFEYQSGLPGYLYDWWTGQPSPARRMVYRPILNSSEPRTRKSDSIAPQSIARLLSPCVSLTQLVYDASKVVTATNCQFWLDFDADTDFPGKGDLCMVALPLLILFGQGAFVPQSFKELLNSIEAADDKPPILNGKPAPGFVDALRALQKNKFHSFFWQDKKVWDG